MALTKAFLSFIDEDSSGGGRTDFRGLPTPVASPD
jgi:hypothetical protein